MKPLDWAVLVGTIVLILAWGGWRELRAANRTSENYLRGGRDQRWWTIGLSVMATQASAITFLSMPGQAFSDGMGFVQFYFGLPLAMVILSAFFLPLYYRLKVYTAYEMLEKRFDRKTRLLTALLFLVSRGLSAGISISAPAIVLSTLLDWPLQWTSLAIGGLTVVYTVSGGTRAVSRTQTYQMLVMLGGMALACVLIRRQLPPSLSLDHAVHLAGALGKMKSVDWSWRFDTRYTFWSGLFGGLFVALAYFGTDQSQVQRYLGGASLSESRLGLLFNGLVKVPMQFLILFVGVLLYVFYLFNPSPLVFDQAAWSRVRSGAHAAEAQTLERQWADASAVRQQAATQYQAALAGAADGEASRAAVDGSADALRAAAARTSDVRQRAQQLLVRDLGHEIKDSDYIFLGFVLRRFPPGLVGLLLAVIVCAAMSATASALNSLGSTTVVDFYRLVRPDAGDAQQLWAARIFTVLWGLGAVAFAVFAGQIDNLIQAVNILGSLFYGPMLGVFAVALFLRHVRATPVFIAALLGQALIVAVCAFTKLAFLWWPVIGCVAVVAAALVIDAVTPRPRVG